MTSKIALLPSLNRNLYHIADHNGRGLFAYGSWGCIYVLDLKLPIPTVEDSKVLRNAHRGKILSLSFCKSAGCELIASISEEMVLKIWNLLTATCIASLEVKESSQIVEWLYDSTNTVVFCETGGVVYKWNFNTNNQVKIKSASDRNITVMSSCQKCPELLAVGHSVGTISILNVNNQTCLKSLKAHSMEITSLSWSSILPSTLLSTSLDQSARVWKLEEDKPLHTYYYPSARYKDKADDKKNFKICSIFHPENPNVIICSNVRGAVGSVLLSENVPPKFTPYSTDDWDQFKYVFQMLPYVDVTGENKHIFVTCEPNKVSLWNISDEKLLSSFQCINNNIFDLSVSPINQNLLAVGSGDGFLKVLNMQAEEKLMVTTIYINLRMKIMSIAWHPTEENIIAYGSDEGRVGIVDFSKKKNLYSFETHHAHSVYSLQWGPCSKINDSKERNFLYSCGGGCIFIHELHKPKVKAVAFETLVKLPADLEVDHKTYSELCWKSDYSCLAIGTFHGSVYLYSDKFDFLCVFSLQIKNLENIRWHPKHTFSSYSKESPYSSWLAAVGNDENIHIFDASDVLNSGATICKSTKTLVGHKKRVSSLCWSTHTDGQLVSGSRDGSVQVWDVITGTPIVNYMGHKDIIYAVQWSVLDPDVIYSGGMDNCLRIWKLSEQIQSEIPSKSHVKKHKTFKVPKRKVPQEVTAVSESHSPSKNETSESKTDVIESSNSSEILPKSDSVKINTKHLKPKFDMMKDKETKSLFNLKHYSKEQCFQNIFKLVDLICDESVSSPENSKQIASQMTSDELLNLGLFADQFTALKMLEVKGKIEEKCNMKDKAVCLQIMACNVAELLTNAAENKELTDFLVSVSPSVSQTFWLSMCEKYAIQLVEEQQFIKSSLYFMLCGKLYDALRMLIDKGKFLDALALAKARLPESDPIIKAILCKVGIQYSAQKQVENEAACYLALKDPLHAAKIMYCAGDAKYAYASVYICKKFNLLEAANEYAVMCLEKCLSQSEWETFYKVAEIVESVKMYKVLARVHEIISAQIKALKKEDVVVGNKIFGATGSKILIWNSKTLENSEVPFLIQIYEILKSENLLSEDKEVLQSVHQALNSLEAREKSETSSEAHIHVAMCVSQVIITSLLGDLSSATKYFTRIFPCTYNVVFIPKVICWTFFPLDVYWCSNEDKFLCEVKKMDTDVIPFAAHFQDIFNSVCNKFECINDSDTEVFTANPDIISNLDVSVQQVLSFLSRKKTEDSFFLYFSTHYLNELRRLAKKGWRFRCYDNDSISNPTPEGLTYIYDKETGRWLINSDTNICEEPISVEDVLKQVEQNNFQLPKEFLSDDTSQNILSIIDVVSHVFSPETDSKTKDEFVQRYMFKDVSDFLQRVMSDEKEITSLKTEQTAVKLSSHENINSQVECSINILPPEEEDFHAQCWTDVGLYYILIKSLFSVTCKDEYALMYFLKKYLLNLDLKIANLARSQSVTSSNQKANASKINVHFNQNRKSKNIKQSKILQSSSKNSISNSISEDSELSVSNDNKTVQNDENKPNNSDETKFDNDNKTVLNDANKPNSGEAKLDNENKTVLNDENKPNNGEAKSDNDNKTVLNDENKPNNSDETKLDNDSKTVLNDENKSDSSEETKLENDNKTVLEDENKPDSSNETKLENEININERIILENGACNANERIKLENGFILGNEKLPKENNLDMAIELDSNPNNFTDVSEENNSDSTGGIESNSNCNLDKAVILNNVVEELKSENGVNLCNNKDVNSELIEEKLVEDCTSVICEKTESCNGISCDIQTDETEKGSESIQSTLQTQRERISEHIKNLQLEGFWYPDPFMSVNDIMGICCDIFYKHPCVLIKQKFHELAHEVNQWYAKYSLTEESKICEICNRTSA